MTEIDYEEVLHRISTVYTSCSAMEQKLLRRILVEVQDKGYSRTLEQLWLVDFKEVPVSIEEFISSPLYMGPVTRNGEAIYPFWRATMKDMFDAGNKYNEVILSGATRIGKTSTAVAILAYMLYRLMLYRNPHEYFKKKEISKFTIGFANLTQDLASGVAFREYNDTLRECPWFMEHGTVSKSARNFYYIPEGDKIDIVAASDAAHMLGMQVWACMVGTTQVLTVDKGVVTLESVCDQYVEVFQHAPLGSADKCRALVKLTSFTCETTRIYIDDENYIEGTSDHLVLLANGRYKEMGQITTSDELRGSKWPRFKIRPAKVRTIIYDHSIPVYDVINVQPHHNFMVVCGQEILVVHNCVVGDTELVLADGTPVPIESVVDQKVDLLQCSDDGELVSSSALVKKTKDVSDTIRIYFDENHFIEGTPDHRVLMSDGSYKMMQDITLDDDVAEVEICHM